MFIIHTIPHRTALPLLLNNPYVIDSTYFLLLFRRRLEKRPSALKDVGLHLYQDRVRSRAGGFEAEAEAMKVLGGRGKAEASAFVFKV